jgi:DNA polymerase-3 subunit beta
MKITVNKKTAIDALSLISASIGTGKTPITANVAIQVNNGYAVLTATDMDCKMSMSIEVDVSVAGSTTIPAAKLLDCLKKSATDTVDVSEKDNKAIVKSGKSRFTLGTLPFEDFPFLNGEYKASLTMPARDLLDMLDDVDYAMHTEEAYHYLNGVYVHNVDGALRVVATDGNRLSLVSSSAVGDFKGVIIPRKTVGILKKSLASAGDVKISAGENLICFDIGGLQIVSKLVDGQFPDYERIIPKEFASEFKCNTANVIGAFERMSVASDGKTNGVKVSVAGNVLKFEAATADSSASDEIEAEYTGDEFAFKVNYKLIVDALRRVSTENTVIKFNNPSTPILVSSENDDVNKFIVCTMRG